MFNLNIWISYTMPSFDPEKKFIQKKNLNERFYLNAFFLE